MDIMQNSFTISMAGFNIRIDTVSTCVCVLCRNYLKEGTPDLFIEIDRDDIDKEYKRSNGIRHSVVSAEITAVYRRIVETLISFNTVLLHGAVIAIGNSAYLFSAPSGTGKTTHIKKWIDNIPESYVINGDKPLIRIIDGSVYVCGTPWSGNESMNTNTMQPLKAIVFMERNETNSMQEISFPEAYPYLLQQTYIPKDADKAKQVLSILSSFYGNISFWRFKCNNFSDDCFETSYNALIGKNYDKAK